jgi:hypothetical protein
MSDWWEVVEREIDRLAEAAPDPWSSRDERLPHSGLTEDQVAFLEQLAHTAQFVADADDWVDPSESQ